nr:MAG TPA: hypothetical protein [Caudoviricetes sp.]
MYLERCKGKSLPYKVGRFRAATILHRERFGKDQRSSSLTYWTYSAL